MTEELTLRQRDLIDHVLWRCPFLERFAWHPVYRPVDEERDSRLCTKFGGNKPFRSDNFTWPVCGECSDHKAFMCQINIANLPPLLKKHIKMTSGLFQFFYCQKCMPFETYEDMYIIKSPDLVPSLKSLAAEKVGALKGYNPMTLPPILRKFVKECTESMGTRWDNDYVVDRLTKEIELPHYEEILDSNSDIAKEIKREANLTDEQYQSFVDCFMTSGAKSVDSGTKLGGWFDWGLGWSDVMYLECPDCEVRMDISFLQILKLFFGNQRKYVLNNGFVMLCHQCKKPGMLRV